MTKVEDQIFEFSCRPGNCAMTEILPAGRAFEADAAAKQATASVDLNRVD